MIDILSPRNVNSAMLPGAVDTAMLRKAAPHLKTETKPEDVAKIIIRLCDPTVSLVITGKIVEIHVVVRGGIRLHPGVNRPNAIHRPLRRLWHGRRVRDVIHEGKEVEIQILSIDKEARRMSLSMKAVQEARTKAETEAAKAEMAAREAATEAAEPEEELKPKKRSFPLRGGK